LFFFSAVRPFPTYGWDQGGGKKKKGTERMFLRKKKKEKRKKKKKGVQKIVDFFDRIRKEMADNKEKGKT
jgi:hypothetical protein